MNTYSFPKTLGKGIKYFVIFVLPYLVSQFIYQMPDIANLTLGALLVMAVNWLKVKGGIRLP